jgi:hypothetical protein
MNCFALAFKRWTESDEKVSLKLLSQLSAVPGSDLSNIRSGKRPISLEALTKLLPAVEKLSNRFVCADLLLAYFRDETPAGYEFLLKISPTLHPKIALSLDPFDERAKRWADKARKDQSFNEMWELLDSYMLIEPSQTNAISYDAVPSEPLAKVTDSELSYPSRINSASPETLESDSLSETDTERILLASMQAAEAEAAATPHPDRSTPETTP